MSRSPELGTALFNTEASWCEVSTTFGTKATTIGPIDVTKFKRPKLVPAYTTQLLNEIKPRVNGTYSGEFTITMMLTGHGSTTNGANAATPTAFETLFEIFLGAGLAASSSGTTATAGGDADSLNVALASGYVAGAPVGPIGTIGDGRGNGQFSVAGSHAASVIELLFAIDATLNNGDVVRNPRVAYTIESPTASHAVTSTRWRFMSGNLMYDANGCFPLRLEIVQLSPGEEPMVRFTFGISYYEEVTATFPDATSQQIFPHAPVANGSCFLNTHGTKTRDATSKLNARSFSITWNLNVIPRKGHGGVRPGQDIIGATRLRATGMVDIVVDAPDATATPDLVTKWKNNAALHLGYVWGAADTQGGFLYCAYVVPDEDSPLQFDSGGIQSLRFRGSIGSDASKSTALERAALRIAQG